jgi:hypothetical protein
VYIGQMHEKCKTLQKFETVQVRPGLCMLMQNEIIPNVLYSSNVFIRIMNEKCLVSDLDSLKTS